MLEAAAEHEAKFPIRFRLSQKFYVKNNNPSQLNGEVVDFSTGLPLWFAPAIADSINSFLIFESELVYLLVYENKGRSDQRIVGLEELGLAFQSLDFQFLHNVSLEKALELRHKGYLSSFRVYLRDLWRVATTTEDVNELDAKIFEFTDRLKAEYETLSREWEAIRRDLRVQAAKSGMIAGLSAGAVIVTGGLSLTMGTIAGAGATLFKEQFSGYTGIKQRMDEVKARPLSVLLTIDKNLRL